VPYDLDADPNLSEDPEAAKTAGLHSAAELTEADILRRFGWSFDQFRTARLLNFPRGHSRSTYAGRHEQVWFTDLIDGWLADVRSLGLDRLTDRGTQ
jgi:hypothetical protein